MSAGDGDEVERFVLNEVVDKIIALAGADAKTLSE